MAARRDRFRTGITPVVAIVLLLMMTVAASGGAYAWMSQVQAAAQDDTNQALASGIDIKDVRCRTHEVTVSVKNSGETELSGETAEIYLQGDDGLAATASINLSSAGFRAPGGFETVSAYLSEALNAPRSYDVEIDIPTQDVSATGHCESKFPESCLSINGSNIDSGNGTYTIDPGVDVFCDMTTDGGGWTRIDHEFLHENPRYMFFGLELNGSTQGHPGWYQPSDDSTPGQFEIGFNKWPNCPDGASSATHWLAEITAPHSFTEIYGSMDVYGWGNHDPDDASGSWDDTNFYRGSGGNQNCNGGGYVVGVTDHQDGTIIKQDGVWGGNFAGTENYTFARQTLGFEADTVTHASTDAAREIVRWEEYRYYIR